MISTYMYTNGGRWDSKIKSFNLENTLDNFLWQATMSIFVFVYSTIDWCFSSSDHLSILLSKKKTRFSDGGKHPVQSCASTFEITESWIAENEWKRHYNIWLYYNNITM